MLCCLVEDARRSEGGRTDRKATHERTYAFPTSLTRNPPGFEEAIRALFADEDQSFRERMVTWPPDIPNQALALSRSNLQGRRMNFVRVEPFRGSA